jgi:ferredoxin--NADP+ reductase
MAKVLDYNATLVAREDITDKLGVFRVKPDEQFAAGAPDGPWFVPGQYMTIGLNREAGTDTEGEDTAVSVRRPMSIASAPEDREAADFYIRYVGTPESDLPLTHLLFRRQAGARMYMRPVATGHFTIEHSVGEEDPRLKVMVAAGTGLAPFISIARSRLEKDPNASLTDLAILHGASYPDDLGYMPELERLVAENGLKYIPTVSRTKEAPDWKGAGGRVEALFHPDRLAETEAGMGLDEGGLVPDRAIIMICGLNGTIATCIQHLTRRGFIPNNRKIRKALEVSDEVKSAMFYEQYDTTPPVDVKDPEVVAKLKADLAQAG